MPAPQSIKIGYPQRGDVLLEDPTLGYDDSLLSRVGQTIQGTKRTRNGKKRLMFGATVGVVVPDEQTLLVERLLPTPEEEADAERRFIFRQLERSVTIMDDVTAMFQKTVADFGLTYAIESHAEQVAQAETVMALSKDALTRIGAGIEPRQAINEVATKALGAILHTFTSQSTSEARRAVQIWKMKGQAKWIDSYAAFVPERVVAAFTQTGENGGEDSWGLSGL